MAKVYLSDLPGNPVITLIGGVDVVWNDKINGFEVVNDDAAEFYFYPPDQDDVKHELKWEHSVPNDHPKYGHMYYEEGAK